MSLAVRIPVDSRSILLRGQAQAVPMLALAGLISALALSLGHSSWWALIALAWLPARALVHRRRGAAKTWLPPVSVGPRGWLSIDAEGRATWLAQSAGQPSVGGEVGRVAEATEAVHGPADPESLVAGWPLEPTSWDLGQQIVSVRGRLSTVQPAPALAQRPILDLVFTRDALSAGQWRGLRVWLLWRQRGGVPGRAL